MSVEDFSTLAQGFIVATPDDAGLVDVVIPAFDDQQKFDGLPCETHGDHGPSLGARCLVARDSIGELWVVSWYGGNSDAAPKHINHGPTGKGDGGGSAVDARGVNAPSSAGSWTNVGSSGTYPAGSNVPIAPWIGPILDFAVDHGWDGTINEGWRSYETQKYYWDHAPEMGLTRGVNVAVPGTSNHGGLQYPQGAIDINDTSGMAGAMRAYHERRKLVWFGPADPPHWSANGH